MAKARKRGPGPQVSPLALLGGSKGAKFGLLYRAEGDTLSVELEGARQRPAREVAAGPDVTIAFNDQGTPLRVEMRGASKHWGKDYLLMLQGPELSLAEAAARIGRSVKTLQAQISNKKLHAVKRGRAYFIAEREIVRYLAELSPAGRRPGT